MLQSGSSCQSPEGKPNARRSTSGYSAKSDCILESMSLPGELLGRLLSSVYDLLNGIFVVMANKKTTRSFEHR